MPSQQFPVIGTDGIVSPGDASSNYTVGLAPYPFFVNGYFEKLPSPTSQSRNYAYIKRTGLHARGLTGTAITAGYKIQGFSASPDRTHAVFFANNGAAAASGFINGINNTGFTAQAGWTATGPVAFTNLDVNTFNGSQWAVTDFNKGAVIDAAGVWTTIVDADFTGLTKVTNFVGIDGYLFIGTSNGRIYNSDLNVPLSWTATSFLTPSDVPGQITWLAKIRNYLIVFKERSIEFFQDAGNPAPGSPLEAVKQLNRTIGCILPSSIQEVSDGIIFAGAHSSGIAKMYKIQRDSLQIVPISNRLVEMGLSVYNTKTAYSADAVALGSYKVQSQVCVYSGKEFYIVNCAPILNNAFGTVSMVYDNALQVWTSWQSCLTTGGVADPFGWNPSQAQTMYSPDSLTSGSWFVDNTTGTGQFYVLLDPFISFALVGYSDKGLNVYNFTWTSDILDFGTRSRKFMDSFELYYTCQTDGTAGTNNGTVTLKYRDLDFNPTAVGTRTLTIDQGGQTRAMVTRLGSFRRRVFSMLDTRALPLAIWGYEVFYNIGETENMGPSR
jgi:hypothetical protein